MYVDCDPSKFKLDIRYSLVVAAQGFNSSQFIMLGTESQKGK